MAFGMCALLAFQMLQNGGSTPVPPELPLPEPVPLDQGWTPSDRQRFHYTSQGTDTFRVPYGWFVALEQPELWIGTDELLLAEPGYLGRFGFVPSPASDLNPGGLPIGFARDPDFVDPHTGKKKEAIGLTCAACHTGVIEYESRRILVEGGSAMVDLGSFRHVLGAAVLYTACVPGRFDRFASRVLKESDTPARRAELRKDFDELADSLWERRSSERKLEGESTEEGFGRLDALTRIGNQVFGYELGRDRKDLQEANLRPRKAPVNFPHVWDAPSFEWVQFNGSIHQPMVRNAGEALGVGAPVDLKPGAGAYRSTARIQDIHALEQMLAGTAATPRLKAPRWPQEIFGALDCAGSQRGAGLFGELCLKCHGSFVGDRDPGDRNLRQIGLVEIATDPEQAEGMMKRDVVNELGEEESFALALGRVVEKVAERWYDEHGISEDQRKVMNGNRPNRLRAQYAYKARPLDGIWATAPYLHNGSVPTLEALLSPEERPASFCRRRFDPKRVGYATDDDCETGFEIELDRSLPGNSAEGHRFANGTRKGTIGRELAIHEREALIAYLKDPLFARDCSVGR